MADQSIVAISHGLYPLSTVFGWAYESSDKNVAFINDKKPKLVGEPISLLRAAKDDPQVLEAVFFHLIYEGIISFIKTKKTSLESWNIEKEFGAGLYNYCIAITKSYDSWKADHPSYTLNDINELLSKLETIDFKLIPQSFLDYASGVGGKTLALLEPDVPENAIKSQQLARVPTKQELIAQREKCGEEMKELTERVSIIDRLLEGMGICAKRQEVNAKSVLPIVKVIDPADIPDEELSLGQRARLFNAKKAIMAHH